MLILKISTISNTIKISTLTLLQRLYGYSQKVIEKVKISTLFLNLSISGRKRIQYKKLKKHAQGNLKFLAENNIKYIYFPLTTEPEVAMHSLAEDFFFNYCN